jgi:hypothetical protein
MGEVEEGKGEKLDSIEGGKGKRWGSVSLIMKPFHIRAT